MYKCIKTGRFDTTFEIAEILLRDKHDLIHKAVGWMLREVGTRCSERILIEFLNKHYRTMPRYSIERFPKDFQKKYLDNGRFI